MVVGVLLHIFASPIGKSNMVRKFFSRIQKYIPIIFFISGFIFDTLTLGRIDRLYDSTVLCLHMTSLTVIIYFFNMVDDEPWQKTFLAKLEPYLPLAIQFFFGGLSSAYVVYFSRSVSLSKTATFFVILVVLLFANEVLKKRISNKYLQFSVYFFISFTFFTFMIPVFIKQMNTSIFIVSGLVSLVSTTLLITLIYVTSPSTRAEIKPWKISALIFLIYATINTLYFFKLIPPVPLALDTGLVAHNVELVDDQYVVTYEAEEWYIFWRKHKLKFTHSPSDPIYIFSSIFAPTDLKVSVYHRWKWYNDKLKRWEKLEDIGFKITGGRDNGFRGYSYKSNVWPGTWKVEVITADELVMGVIDFDIVKDDGRPIKNLKQDNY